MESYDALRSFRRSFYECLHRRKDALFELGDAILTAEAVSSPVHLSLQESHRRGWGRASTPRWIAGESTSRLCGTCSQAIRSPEEILPSTPWT
jgi:hypothetical protein